jgi:putative lipoprotein
MRSPWIAAVAALALLAGCQQGNQQNTSAQHAAAPAIAPGTTINGSITLREPVPIAAGATLTVKLVDVAQPEVPIAEKSLPVTGEPPYTFALDFDPARIAPDRTYVVNAVLTDGDRHFVAALSTPVLTHTAGTSVQIVLNAEPTESEKLAEACSHIEKQIGGMKTVAGTYTTEESSVGWDAFAQSGSVRFVRVNTDFDKGGHSSANFAYDAGQPMCAKQPGGVRAKWVVGWNPAGEVVFRGSGGSEPDDATVSALRDAATKALQMAQEKVDASRRR